MGKFAQTPVIMINTEFILKDPKVQAWMQSRSQGSLTLKEKQEDLIAHFCTEACVSSAKAGIHREELRRYPGSRFFCHQAAITRSLTQCYLTTRMDALGKVALGPDSPAFVAEYLSTHIVLMSIAPSFCNT